MRILVDTGEPGHRDRGDAAVLQVAVRRLAGLWPDDPVGVLTGDPERLAALVPEAVPVTPATGWDVAPAGRPTARRRWTLRRAPAAGPDPGWVDRVLEGVGLVVAGGGQHLSDTSPERAERVLTLLTGAQTRGIPTLMFGQGLTPLTDPRLVGLARAALPGLQQLAVRDRRAATATARDLGVPDERVVVTGDDAVALARPAAAPRLGDGLGVNHRAARGADPHRHTETVRRAVQTVAGLHGAALVPIPLTGDADEAAGTAAVTRGHPEVLSPGMPDDPPSWSIRRLDRVRLVVTPAYHLAVFALSRGVPVVCPVATDAEAEALSGLAEQFTPGCVVVDLRPPDAPGRLLRAVDGMWGSADDVRHHLLEAADAQIAIAERAYATARDLVSPPVIPRH